MTKTLPIVLALSILPAVHAAGETQISVGAGVGVAPEYIGSDGEFTMQVQQLQKKTPISDTAKNIKTLQETEYGCLPSYYAN